MDVGSVLACREHARTGVPAIHGGQKKTALLRCGSRECPAVESAFLLLSEARAADDRPPLRDASDYGVYVAVSVMPDAAV